MLFLFLLIGLLTFLPFAGRALVSDRPEKADVIVVLAGDSIDQRYRRGMELLRAGYGKHLFLDASSDSNYFGHTPAEYAAAFLKEDAHEMEPLVSVCPFEEDSTMTETLYVAKCVETFQPQRVLLVTSDFHTSRALSIFAHRLPQYQWSVDIAAICARRWRALAKYESRWSPTVPAAVGTSPRILRRTESPSSWNPLQTDTR